MFIDENAMFVSTPFGGAEVNGVRFAQFERRSSERRPERRQVVVYKHLTPNVVKAEA